MEASLICTKSKQGLSLSQISELTGLTIDEVKERLGNATGLTPKDVGILFDMTQRGLSLEQLNQETGVELEVLKQFLPEVLEKPVETQALAGQGEEPYEISFGVNERASLAYTLGSSDDCNSNLRLPPKTTEETKEPHKPQPTKLPKPQPSHSQPTFFYSCKHYANKLHRVNLLTGERSRHKVPNYEFKQGCRWSEMPWGSLLITGGGPSREVVKIDTLRECAVSAVLPMHSRRWSHAEVYYSQYVYVLGGSTDRFFMECERYVCADSRWEELPAMPEAAAYLSAVELENSLYALGGSIGRRLDTVQRLSLDSLTWELMQLKLPRVAHEFPCFKTDTEVYLVIKRTLYSFTPLQVKPIKSLSRKFVCDTSYYSRGTLYYDDGRHIGSFALGEITSP
jgi:hypothetical protein